MPPTASNFPVLGQARSLDLPRSPSPSAPHSSSQLQPQEQSPSPASHTPSSTLSPTVSGTLSSDWIEKGQDEDILLLTSMSCNVLLRTFAKLVNAPSESAQKPVNKPRQTKDGPGRKKSFRSRRVSGKGKQNTSEDELDDGDDQRDPKRQRSDAKDAGECDIRPLACPFNKYDNILFGPGSPDDAYHGCSTCSFVSVAHLKQHLQRNHYVPRYYCFRCCRRDFSSQGTVAAHLREHPICPILEPPLYGERIGSDLVEELGLDRKNSPGTDRVEYWHKIYDTFFPGAADARPVSPYYEGPAAEHLRQFLRFSERALEQLIPAVRSRLGLPEILSTGAQLRLHQEIQQEAGQRYLQYILGRSMPRLGRPVPASGEVAGSGAGQDPGFRIDSSAPWEPSPLANATPETIQRSRQLESACDIAASAAAALDTLPSNFRASHVDGAAIPPALQFQESQLDQHENTTLDPLSGDEWFTTGIGSPQHFERPFSPFGFPDIE